MISEDKTQSAVPFDQLCVDLKLTNTDLVRHSTEQLTFKQVNKARAGRRITVNIQNKIIRALNNCVGENRFKIDDVFRRENEASPDKND